MLVQKSLTPARKRIIIIGLVVVMVGLGYIVYNQFLKDKLAIKPSTTNTAVNSQPVSVPKFNRELFQDPKIFDLQAHGKPGFAEQYQAAATDNNTPYPVENIRAVDSGLGGIIYLWWDLPAKINFSKIVIYRSFILGQAGDELDVLGPAEKTYKDTNLENNINYYYTVKTRNDSKTESQNEEQVSTAATDKFPPSPPSDISVEDKGDGKNILISWTNPKDTDFSYTRIYRSTDKGQIGYLIYDQFTGDPGQNKEKLDDQTTAGAVYYYTLTSVDKNGNESGKTMAGPTGRTNPFEPIIF
jgi:hypothetical protein